MRPSLGSTVSKRVTVWPASARWSVRAVRKMVSPSGMSGRLWLGGLRDAARLLDMKHLEAERGGDEAGLFEEARQEVFARRGAVDLADEQAAAAALPSDSDLGELAGQFARESRALGFVFRQDYAGFRIAAPQKRGEL